MGQFWKRNSAPNYGDQNYMTLAFGGRNRCIPGNDGSGHQRSDGFVLPNCTGYVHGRLLETLGSSNLSINDAYTYYAYNDGYPRGQEAKIGAVMCWSGGGAGHVAIVEEIYSDGSFLISQSGWNYLNYWTTRCDKNNHNPESWIQGYTFQGFIYPPYDTPGPTPTETKKHKFKWVLFG